jgi:Histidine kinase-, DNA gyrase B-, and HSP90-like ATPase
LFERFHRIEKARARSNEGSGIGLALVQELIALHGGSITASSVEGGGTTFTVRLPFGHAHLPADALVPVGRATTVSATADPFVQEALRWLPRAAPDADDGTAARSVHEETRLGGDAGPRSEAGGTTPARVLVADDNADMREYLARLLRTAGYQVTAVTDGQAALNAIRADHHHAQDRRAGPDRRRRNVRLARRAHPVAVVHAADGVQDDGREPSRGRPRYPTASRENMVGCR